MVAPETTYQHITRYVAGVIQGFCIFSLLIYFFPFPWSHLFFTSLWVMWPDTAIAGFLLATAIQLQIRPSSNQSYQSVVAVLNLTVVILAVASLSLDLLASPDGLHRFVPYSKIQLTNLAPRMPTNSSLAFLCISLAVLYPRQTKLFYGGLLVALLIYCEALISYLYQSTALPPNSFFQQMSVTSTATGFLLVLIILTSRRDPNLTMLLNSQSTTGVVLRLLIPTLLVPIALGWICLESLRLKILGGEQAIMLIVIAMIACLWLMLIRGSQVLHHLTQARSVAEAALETNRLLLQSILDSSSTIIYIKDLEGRYQLVNHQFSVLLEPLGTNPIGCTSADLFAPDITQHIHQHEQQVLVHGQEIEFEEQFLRNQTPRTYLSLKFPLRNSAGQIYALGSISTDITERKQAEAAQQQLQNERQHLLEQAQQAVNERDAFFSVTAHEIRSPLTSILGFAELLQQHLARGEVPIERSQRALEVIREEGQRLSLLINDMLHISRGTTDQLIRERVPFDLGHVFDRLIAALQPQLSIYHLHVTFVQQPNLVVGDPMRVEQVFRNLLENALKFSPRGSNITIYGKHTQNMVEVAISDQGIGIAPERQPYVFQRFYRAPEHANIPGSGIGLYLVNEIINQLGGTIHVTSTVGVGSTFVVRLPRYSAGSAAVQDES